MKNRLLIIFAILLLGLNSLEVKAFSFKPIAEPTSIVKTAPITDLPKFSPSLFGDAGGGTTVLGHYPAYTKLASKLGANRFQIPTNVWNKMTAAEQWVANTKFLDRIILRGDNIRLATPLSKVKPSSFYQKELNYLFGKGYKVSSDGLWLVK